MKVFLIDFCVVSFAVYDKFPGKKQILSFKPDLPWKYPDPDDCLIEMINVQLQVGFLQLH